MSSRGLVALVIAANAFFFPGSRTGASLIDAVSRLGNRLFGSPEDSVMKVFGIAIELCLMVFGMVAARHVISKLRLAGGSKIEAGVSLTLCCLILLFNVLFSALLIFLWIKND